MFQTYGAIPSRRVPSELGGGASGGAAVAKGEAAHMQMRRQTRAGAAIHGHGHAHASHGRAHAEAFPAVVDQRATRTRLSPMPFAHPHPHPHHATLDQQEAANILLSMSSDPAFGHEMENGAGSMVEFGEEGTADQKWNPSRTYQNSRSNSLIYAPWCAEDVAVAGILVEISNVPRDFHS